MRKITTLLFVVLLLVGCKQEVKQEETNKLLYLSSTNPNTNKLGDVLPRSINIYDEQIGLGYVVDDEDAIKEIVNLIKKVEIGNKTDAGEGNNFSITLEYSNNDYDGFYFYGTYVEKTNNDNIEYYKTYYSEELINYCKDYINSAYVYKGETIEVLNKEGIVIKQNDVQKKGNDYSISFDITNNSDEDIYVRLLPNINGHDIHSYQLVGVKKKDNIGYDLTVTSSLLLEFGVKNINSIDYELEVYKADLEKNKEGERLFISDKQSIKINEEELDEKLVLDNPIFEAKSLKIYSKIVKGSINDNLYLCIVNEGNKDCEIVVKGIEMNNNYTDYSEGDYFVINVPSKNDKFALIPIYNFEYDEASQTTKTIEIESLNLAISVKVGEETVDSADLKVK